ncbi:hypothetical protein, partial [Dyella choica]|uniref:hypothetical protein n=1 Tax=Dyella choica TaxID=1927959 RepID=UPI001E55A794
LLAHGLLHSSDALEFRIRRYFSLGQQRKVTRSLATESAAGNATVYEIHRQCDDENAAVERYPP